MQRAKLFIISGPAGVGKDTLVTAAMSRLPDLVKSVSVTTRPRAPGESEGHSYFFVSEEAFGKLLDSGELLEWARVHEHFYGTPAKWVREQIASGRSVIMNIDVQGGLKIKEKSPEAVLIFVMPPGSKPLEALRQRLTGRGRDPDEEIEVRLKDALWEMSCAPRYDLQIVNDDVCRASEQLVQIIQDASDTCSSSITDQHGG